MDRIATVICIGQRFRLATAEDTLNRDLGHDAAVGEELLRLRPCNTAPPERDETWVIDNFDRDNGDLKGLRAGRLASIVSSAPHGPAVGWHGKVRLDVPSPDPRARRRAVEDQAINRLKLTTIGRIKETAVSVRDVGIRRDPADSGTYGGSQTQFNTLAARTENTEISSPTFPQTQCHPEVIAQEEVLHAVATR